MSISFKPIISLLVVLIVLLPVFAPVVNASVIYGPVKYVRDSGSPSTVVDSFTVDNRHGNYTLFVRHGDDISNGSSSALITLNRNTIVKTNEFKQKVRLIKKNLTIQDLNELGVEVRSKPGSSITIWIEDETPDIVITSPWDDTVSNGSVTVAGRTVDKTITSATISNNGVTTTVPVSDGNFSAIIDINGVTNITISAIDSTGTLRMASILLDGDMLPEPAEKSLRFDPLDPDSDCSLTEANEADNGVLDGYEMFGSLPVFVEYRIGSDPFKEDTDSDGLTDYFELMKMGLFTDVCSGDTDNDMVPDAQEDMDNDSLTNLQEQNLDTDPLVADTDKDSLLDGFEVNIGSNPILKDTDNDGLADDSELRLGTNPCNVDTDGDGIPDSDEVYTSIKTVSNLGVSVAVTGEVTWPKNWKLTGKLLSTIRIPLL